MQPEALPHIIPIETRQNGLSSAGPEVSRQGEGQPPSPPQAPEAAEDASRNTGQPEGVGSSVAEVGSLWSAPAAVEGVEESKGESIGGDFEGVARGSEGPPPEAGEVEAPAQAAEVRAWAPGDSPGTADCERGPDTASSFVYGGGVSDGYVRVNGDGFVVEDDGPESTQREQKAETEASLLTPLSSGAVVPAVSASGDIELDATDDQRHQRHREAREDYPARTPVMNGDGAADEPRLQAASAASFASPTARLAHETDPPVPLEDTSLSAAMKGRGLDGPSHERAATRTRHSTNASPAAAAAAPVYSQVTCRYASLSAVSPPVHMLPDVPGIVQKAV